MNVVVSNGNEKAMVSRENEILIKDVVNAFIGAAAAFEEGIRFQAARVLIRWYELVIRGEDDKSPAAVAAREKFDRLLQSVLANKEKALPAERRL